VNQRERGHERKEKPMNDPRVVEIGNSRKQAPNHQLYHKNELKTEINGAWQLEFTE
jgi:hypothetical protein